MSKLEGLILLTPEKLINFLSEIVLKEHKDKAFILPENLVEKLFDLNKNKAEFRFFNYTIKKNNNNEWEVNEVV